MEFNKRELEVMLQKKLYKLESWPIHCDKLNFIVAQNKGNIGKIYKLAIRRQFYQNQISKF